MDNLVLTTVARALDQGLRGSALVEFRQESADRYRLTWEHLGKARSTLISMRPDAPWIGRPLSRAPRTRPHPGAFLRETRRGLLGACLDRVIKPDSERTIELRFADRRALVIELALHGANLVLLDEHRAVLASLRQPKSARGRLTVAQRYEPRERPVGKLDPFVATAAQMDAELERLEQTGETLFEGLRRHLFGMGTPAATLICEEAASAGLSAGEVLERRLARLRDGEEIPVIEAPVGCKGPEGIRRDTCELWPWEPARRPREGFGWLHGGDAAETAGWWHEALDGGRATTTRRANWSQLVRRERSKTAQAVRKCESDLQAFEDPERFRRWAEALLAGLSQAKRVGAAVQVPDPECADGGDLVIPVPPGVALPAVAERLFVRYRRAVRGHERAGRRLSELVERGRALDELAAGFERAGWTEEVCLDQMRRLNLPVALEPATRSGREVSRRTRPRLEGVRVYHASTGEMILAGKGGRENHRLTFKLAAPHDFWFHALGVPGAHVILRNDARASRPGSALAEAAAVAAYHSEAARQPFADVQWTQRKNVRKPRGASPGTVILKRFETIRVRPGVPGGQAEAARKR